MAKTTKILAETVARARAPRERGDIFKEYNGLRQDYILRVVSRHFGAREDDPAPLLGKRLLDAGCGESTVGEFLALSGAEIVAVEANRATLKKAQASAAAFGAPITFVAGKVENLLQGGGKFEVILALDLLEDVEEAGKVLWVLRQLLAADGILVFSCIKRTWRAWVYHVFLSALYGRTAWGSRRWRRFKNPDELAQLCAAAGLKLREVRNLRFSLSKQRWKMNDRRRGTRYMAYALVDKVG